MSKNFFRAAHSATTAEPAAIFALKTDPSRTYTKEQMLRLAGAGRFTEDEFLGRFNLVNGGTMIDIRDVIDAINDFNDRASSASTSTEPAATSTPVSTSVEDPKITDEDGKKVRAALFFDGKTLVDDKKANELIKTFGIDPSKFAYHKYATKNGKIVAGTRLPGDLGNWDPKA